MALNATLSGISEALTKLTKLEENLGNRTELHDAIGLTLREATDERFSRGIGPDGRAWPGSLRAKLRGGQTLRDTGLLQSSITWRADRSGLDFGAIGLGSNLNYARIHQYGGVIRPKNKKALAFFLPDGSFVQVKKVVMPARPYIGISSQDEEDIIDLCVTYIKDVFKNG